MPKPEADLVLVPRTAIVQVALEPAINILNSLVMLSQVEKYSGLGEWINQTASDIKPEDWERHRIVFEGLYFALLPERSFPSFEAYIEDLAATDPLAMRDKVLEAYLCKAPTEDQELYREDNWRAVLRNEDTFIDFMRAQFGSDHIDEKIERAAYAFLLDPAAMRNLIVSHIRFMWEDFMAEEWERVLPTLEESVTAFQKVDFTAMSLSQAAQFITGKETDKHIEEHMQQAERIFFVPSTHGGPYVLKYLGNETLWMTFGARLPQGALAASPDLRRSDLLVRLAALADETRLRILAIIREQGEICSQELIDQLGISQSSISRHLRQLTATGYLVERRTEAGKCFNLNTERIGETLQALDGFFE